MHPRYAMWFPMNKEPNNVAQHPIGFSSKSLMNAEICYRNIEREVLGILHGLKCFTTTASPVR